MFYTVTVSFIILLSMINNDNLKKKLYIVHVYSFSDQHASFSSTLILTCLLRIARQYFRNKAIYIYKII